MQQKKAFTLVELLVVIAIISVLAALLLPTLADALEMSRRIACANNQKQLYTAAVLYANDYNDHLPHSGQAAGGSNISFSQLGDQSTNIWVFSYVPQALYSAVKRFNGVQLSSVTGGVGSFYLPSMRGPLNCPSSNMMAAYDKDWRYADREFDYWMSGFGASNGGTDPEILVCRHSKLRKASAPYLGSPKSFIIDNLWLSNMSHAAYLYTYASCHAPGKPTGVNVTAGDGSTRWTEEMFQVSGWLGTKAAPKGYYTQQYWHGWGAGTFQQCVVGMANGTNVPYKTFEKPKEYRDLRNQWY